MNNTKKCTKCNMDLKLSKDNFRTLSSGYWSSHCRSCEKISNKIWYENNKRKHQGLVKRWKKENPEKTKIFLKKSHKKYYEANKEEILQKKAKYRKRPEVVNRTNEWNRIRRENDPKIKLKQNISRAVNYALKKSSGSKNRQSIWNVLNYTKEDLKKHLESQWEEWMNWENYGVYEIDGPLKWHIDHIIPQSKLPYGDMKHPNFLKCWSLNNLRPLEAIDNIAKGNN